MYKTVAEIAQATNDLLVATSRERGTHSDSEIASLYKVPVSAVASTKEPQIVPVKNLVRWNNDRLDGKNV